MARKTAKRVKHSRKRYTLRRFHKPSDLLEAALQDLRKVEKMRKVYAVNMSSWHSSGKSEATPWEPETRCRVCLAGSVMAMTLHVPPSKGAGPSDFWANGDYFKLVSINTFRTGAISSGVTVFARGECERCGEWPSFGLESARLHEVEMSFLRFAEAKYSGHTRQYGVVNYADDPGPFKRWMADMIRHLRKHGM